MEKTVQILLSALSGLADERILFDMAVHVVSLPSLLCEYHLYGFSFAMACFS
jgi:hypothetical protein